MIGMTAQPPRWGDRKRVRNFAMQWRAICRTTPVDVNSAAASVIFACNISEVTCVVGTSLETKLAFFPLS